jgi:signal peptidase I
MRWLLNTLPSPLRVIVEVLLTLGVAALVVWVARDHVANVYLVPTASMEPALKPGDYVVADRLSLDFMHPSRYQIVVFHPPHCTRGHNGAAGVCDTTDLAHRDGLAGVTFIKRVIGLPGDIVWANDGDLWVKPAHGTAFRLHEPYVHGSNELAGLPLFRTAIPKGYYLMLGDNRPVSDDSRGWGLEPRGGIIAIVRARYWPLSRIGGL